MTDPTLVCGSALTASGSSRPMLPIRVAKSSSRRHSRCRAMAADPEVAFRAVPRVRHRERSSGQQPCGRHGTALTSPGSHPTPSGMRCHQAHHRADVLGIASGLGDSLAPEARATQHPYGPAVLGLVRQILRESGEGTAPFVARGWLAAFLRARSPALGGTPQSTCLTTLGPGCRCASSCCGCRAARTASARHAGNRRRRRTCRPPLPGSRRFPAGSSLCGRSQTGGANTWLVAFAQATTDCGRLRKPLHTKPLRDGPVSLMGRHRTSRHRIGSFRWSASQRRDTNPLRLSQWARRAKARFRAARRPICVDHQAEAPYGPVALGSDPVRAATRQL